MNHMRVQPKSARNISSPASLAVIVIRGYIKNHEPEVLKFCKNYIHCKATGVMRPKFVNKQTAMPHYKVLQMKKTMVEKPQPKTEQWVKDL